MKTERINTLSFPFATIVENQCNCSLSLLHTKFPSYEEAVKQFDLMDSSFYLFYKLLAKKYIKKYLQKTRIVVSYEPKLILSYPNQKTNSNFSHPLDKGFHSIFVPFTEWFDSNTILIGSDPMPVNYGNIYFIHNKDLCRGFQGVNLSNNSSLGMVISCSTYEAYKLSNIKDNYTIGNELNLL